MHRLLYSQHLNCMLWRMRYANEVESSKGARIKQKSDGKEQCPLTTELGLPFFTVGRPSFSGCYLLLSPVLPVFGTV
eukprot:6189058-Pleurochrysis_carterae.AAC.5